MLFLIGSIAICGIPPLNGFISEFIIFNGFFATAKELQNYYPLLMLIMTVGLAFVGGLAVACFTKINSIMFLGTPRREIEKFDITFYEYLSLGILAFLCVIIGFVPQPVIALINSVLKSEMIATDESSRMIDINWLHVTSVFIVLSGGIVIIYALKKYFQNKYGIRRSAAWGCGYADQTPRMQYTASSYANELNEITRSVLLYQKKGSVSKDVFPADNSFESHAHDYIDNKIIISGFSKLRSFISRLDFVGFTDIRYYIGFILVIITIYCLMALIWG
jgi:NADH:ubiquinone oxidoreductase subunit 5 (subunit L)/multisubunit Na+/H+ antiporter MnhA subunit